MFSKLKMFSVLIILFISCALFSEADDDGFFRVPVEPLPDDDALEAAETNPELLKLKRLQNRFFKVMDNSSIGRDFTGFNQILELIDSDAGKEMSRLLVHGFITGIQQKNPGQVFAGFWEEFQYRVPPKLSRALIDYRDFFRTLDIRTLPAAMELIFRKDEFGKSLADMPLGDLIDLVQPEASKYGIDLRAVLDGILGKNGSKFPNMFQKAIWNLNTSSLMRTLTDFIPVGNELNGKESAVKKSGKSNVDKALQIFKPFLANILRQYNTDLDTDAVIQVITPFAEGIGEYVKSTFSTFGKNGKEFNFMQLLPLFSLLNSGLGESRTKSGKTKADGEALDISSIINVASQLIDGKQGQDKLNLNDMSNFLNMFTKDLDLGSLVDIANKLITFNTKVKKGKPLQLQPPRPKQRSQATKKSLTDAIEPLMLTMQTDKQCHTKIRDAIAFGKAVLKHKKVTFDSFRKLVSSLIDSFLSQDSIPPDFNTIDRELLNSALSFKATEWKSFMDHLKYDNARESVVLNAAPHAADLVKLFAQPKVQKRISELITSYSRPYLTDLGISDVTLENFPQKFAVLLGTMSTGWKLPFSLTNLLNPLQSAIVESKAYILSALQELDKLPRKQLEYRVMKSLDSDVLGSVQSVYEAYESVTDPHCLPPVLCRTVGIEGISLLRQFLLRISCTAAASLSYQQNGRIDLLLEGLRASLGADDCQESFPSPCLSEEASVSGEENEQDKGHKPALHEEL